MLQVCDSRDIWVVIILQHTDKIIHKMHTRLSPGTYVVAVSGGVDSVVLLDLLQKQPDLKLVVAHYDHGIRPDSDQDKRLVKERAEYYGLPFVSRQGHLGADASEALARRERYKFLHEVRKAADAKAVVTAHHQDDVVETAVMNLLRGTGRRGLSSLRSTDVIVRPLLRRNKEEIKAYALSRNLPWREDSTNTDLAYRRNYIRHVILPKLSHQQKQALLELIHKAHDLNDEIEAQLINHLHVRLHDDQLERKWFIQLSHNVAREVIYAWLRRHRIKDIDARRLELIVVAAKAYHPGRRIDVDVRHVLWVQRDYLALRHIDR